MADFIFRLKICKKICKPAENSMTATEVSTYSNKQYIRQQMKEVALEYPKPTQNERKQRVVMNRYDRWTGSDQMRIEKRHNISSTVYHGHLSSEKHNGLWNRDINAARNIIYLGLCRYGGYIDPKLQNIIKNTAFSRPSRQE